MTRIVSALSRSLRAGRFLHRTHPYPGANARSGQDIMLSVTSTAAAPTFESSKVHSLTRPNIVSVGTIVWLSSELMFFAGLFAMYFTMRAVHPGDWPMKILTGEHAG